MIAINMTREELSALTAVHASCLQRAREHERAATRYAVYEPNRAELCADQAAEARKEAAALAKVLAPHGVETPPTNQLALWSDGGPARTSPGA